MISMFSPQMIVVPVAVAIALIILFLGHPNLKWMTVIYQIRKLHKYTQITYEVRSATRKLSDRIICIDYLDGTVVRRITLFWSFPSNKEAEKACDRIAELVANKKISQKLVSYRYTPKSEIKE